MTMKPLKHHETDLVARVVEQACTQLGQCDQSMMDRIVSRVTSSATAGERHYETLMSIALSGFPVPRGWGRPSSAQRHQRLI
jgi:hypothetical protein